MNPKPMPQPTRDPRWSTAPGHALLEYRDEILALAALHRAHRVRVFGSMARGETSERSDLDLLVEFEQGASLLDSIALQQDLEDRLGIPVDVVTEKAMHPLILERVLHEARPL